MDELSEYTNILYTAMGVLDIRKQLLHAYPYFLQIVCIQKLSSYLLRGTNYMDDSWHINVVNDTESKSTITNAATLRSRRTLVIIVSAPYTSAGVRYARL